MADPMASTSTSTAGGSDKAGSASQGVVDKLRGTAEKQLSSQKERATDSLGNVADAVRHTTEQLKEQQHDTIAGFAEQAADQIDRWSQHLRRKNVGELISDLQDLSRKQPALFVGGAFALGVIGARFMKSSSAGRRQQWRGDYASPMSPSSGNEYRSYAQATGATRSGIGADRVHDYQAAGYTATNSESVGSGQSGAGQGSSTDLGTNEAEEPGGTEAGTRIRARRGTQSERV